MIGFAVFAVAVLAIVVTGVSLRALAQSVKQDHH